MHRHSYQMNEQICALADTLLLAQTDPDQLAHIRTLSDHDLLTVVRKVGIEGFMCSCVAGPEMLRRSGRLDCNFPEDAFDGHAKGHGSILIAE